MEIKRPDLKTLGDLFGHDLRGWQIRRCYILEARHSVSGLFPVVLMKSKQPAVTFEKSFWEKVWEQLPPLPCVVTAIWVLVNPVFKIAFSLESHDKESAKPLTLIDESDISNKRTMFEWAPNALKIVAKINAPPPSFAGD